MNRKVLEEIYYTFIPSTKTIRFSQVVKLEQKDILLIVNLNGNHILYNFACSDEGGTLSGNVLTLVKDTSDMTPTDKLMVIVLDQDRSENYLKEILEQMRNQNEMIEKYLTHKNISL